MSFWADALNLVTSRASRAVNYLLKGKMTETYELNSDNVIDCAKARAMYANTENTYKLGAGIIRPILGTDVSFIGEPDFVSDDEMVQDALDEITSKAGGFFQAAHLVALREGDLYVWPQYSADGVDLVGMPVDKLEDVIRNPITGEVVEYRFKYDVSYKDRSGAQCTITIGITINADIIAYRYTGAVPAGLDNYSVRNVLGEIPVVQLSNECEDFETRGHSEITAIEPYIKAYHDVMKMALQAQKNNAAPKMKIKTKNIQQFVDNNFGSGTFSKLQAGTETISIEGKDLLIFNAEGEDAEYLTVQSTITSAEPLLRLLFYLILETSETLELVFGASLDTSRASTDNQLPVYVKKIERKQTCFERAWYNVMRIALKLKGFTAITDYGDNFSVRWPSVDFESASMKATVLKDAVTAFSGALQNGIMSFEEVHAESKKYFPEIAQSFEAHIDQIKESEILITRFGEDSYTQQLNREGEAGAMD